MGVVLSSRADLSAEALREGGVEGSQPGPAGQPSELCPDPGGGGTSDFDSGATRFRRLHRSLFSCFVPPSSVLRPPPSPLISVLRHLSSVLRPPSPSCVPVISCFPALSHRLPSSVFRPPSSVLRLPPSPPSCVPVFPAFLLCPLCPLSSVLCPLAPAPCPLPAIGNAIGNDLPRPFPLG